jgi:hypothetical protein
VVDASHSDCGVCIGQRIMRHKSNSGARVPTPRRLGSRRAQRVPCRRKVHPEAERRGVYGLCGGLYVVAPHVQQYQVRRPVAPSTHRHGSHPRCMFPASSLGSRRLRPFR